MPGMPAPGKYERVYYHVEFNHPTDYTSEEVRYETYLDAPDSNVVSSKTTVLDQHLGYMHAPALDIDVPIHVVPSSTPGHSHLYIDVLLSWERYAALLDALARAGIIEHGYADASLRRGASFLRKPGVVKERNENDGAM